MPPHRTPHPTHVVVAAVDQHTFHDVNRGGGQWVKRRCAFPPRTPPLTIASVSPAAAMPPAVVASVARVVGIRRCAHRHDVFVEAVARRWVHLVEAIDETAVRPKPAPIVVRERSRKRWRRSPAPCPLRLLRLLLILQTVRLSLPHLRHTLRASPPRAASRYKRRHAVLL